MVAQIPHTQLRVLSTCQLCGEPISLQLLSTLLAIEADELEILVQPCIKLEWLEKTTDDSIHLTPSLDKDITRTIDFMSLEVAKETINRMSDLAICSRIPARLVSRFHQVLKLERGAATLLYACSTKEVETRNLKSAFEHCWECVTLLRGRLLEKDDYRLFLSATLLLSDLCYVLRKGYYEIRQILLEAAEVALGLGDKRVCAVLYLHVGRIAVFLRMLNEAVRDWEKGFALVTEMGDGDMMAQSSPFYASYFFTQGLCREAAAYAEKAVSMPLSHATQVPDYMIPTILAMSSALMGHFSRAIGVLDSHWRRSLSDGGELPGIFMRANLGQVLLMCGKSNEALNHLTEAMNAARSSGDIVSLFWAGRALAYHHFLEGRFRDSHRTLSTCMNDARLAGLPKLFYATPWFLEMLSQYHQMNYEPIPGCEYQQEMQSALSGINILLKGVALRIRAKEISQKSGHLAETKALLLQSEAELERSGAAFELAKTRAELSLLEHASGSTETARDLALKSWEGWMGLEAIAFPPELKSLIGGQDSPSIIVQPEKHLLKRYMEMMDGLIPIGEPDEIWGRVLSAACQFFEAERGGIFSLEKSPRGWKTTLLKGHNLTPAQLHEKHFQLHLSAVEKTHESRVPIITRFPKVDQGSLLNEIYHVACLPISRGRQTGVVLYCDMRCFSKSLELLDNAILEQFARSMGSFTTRALEYAQRTEEKSRATLGEITTRPSWQSDATKDFGPAFRELMSKADQIASSDASVLILGETGVGKEVLARRIHDQSHRATGPFVAVDLSSIPEGLVESEIFGHEKGAFTGADRQKPGRMELAHRGTLFIDEVGEVPKSVQVKLLRAIEDRSFVRVGGIVQRSADFRLIAATNRDLIKEVKDGHFREDLYYRLCVVPFVVPPLRERGSDVIRLAEHFLSHYARKYHRPMLTLSSEQKAKLKAYTWPGNIRELRNVIERSLILSGQDKFNLDMTYSPLADHGEDRGRATSGRPTLDEVQRSYILQVLNETGGRLSGPRGAAAILGIKRSTLQHRMTKLGISKQTS